MQRKSSDQYCIFCQKGLNENDEESKLIKLQCEHCSCPKCYKDHKIKNEEPECPSRFCKRQASMQLDVFENNFDRKISLVLEQAILSFKHDLTQDIERKSQQLQERFEDREAALNQSIYQNHQEIQRQIQEITLDLRRDNENSIDEKCERLKVNIHESTLKKSNFQFGVLIFFLALFAISAQIFFQYEKIKALNNEVLNLNSEIAQIKTILKYIQEKNAQQDSSLIQVKSEHQNYTNTTSNQIEAIIKQEEDLYRSLALYQSEIGTIQKSLQYYEVLDDQKHSNLIEILSNIISQQEYDSYGYQKALTTYMSCPQIKNLKFQTIYSSTQYGAYQSLEYAVCYKMKFIEQLFSNGQEKQQFYLERITEQTIGGPFGSDEFIDYFSKNANILQVNTLNNYVAGAFYSQPPYQNGGTLIDDKDGFIFSLSEDKKFPQIYTYLQLDEYQLLHENYGFKCKNNSTDQICEDPNYQRLFGIDPNYKSVNFYFYGSSEVFQYRERIYYKVFLV